MSASTSWTERSNGDPPRLVVVSDHGLIGEAVRMALVTRGFSALSVRLPAGGRQSRGVERRLQDFRPHVGLLLAEVDDAAKRRVAVPLVQGVPARWLLLTSATDDAACGALVAAGVLGVLPMSIGLDALIDVLDDVRVGRDVMPEEARQRVTRAWRDVSREERRLRARMATLTPREMIVLGLLNDGLSVRTIANGAGVSEGTVRSQVKSILRKLQVGSQLAAVAAYRQFAVQVRSAWRD